MDTITHGLAGALAGRAAAGSRRGAGLPAGRAAVATGVACMFPDADFIIALFDAYAYLEWHRLVTHSLVLLPVWMVLLAGMAGLMDRRMGWRAYLPYVAVGLALHIVVDAFNIWPLQPLWPVLDWEVAWPVLFVIDPIYTVIIVLGLFASVFWRVRRGAWIAIMVVAVYTAMQFPLNAHALRHTADMSTTHAFGQPFSPLHRRVVAVEEDGLRWAFLRQFSRRALLGYEPVDQLEWRAALHPMSAGDFVAEAWQRPELARYRDFARFPFVYGIEPEEGVVCAWFADVRFTLPGLPPAFRYGMCRSPDGAWSRHRKGRW